MSAVKVLRCPIRHQFAPIKACTKTDSIWRGGVLVVQKTHKPQWFTHTKAPSPSLSALLMKTCMWQRAHNKARRAECRASLSLPACKHFASASASVLSMIIKARVESGNQRSASVCLSVCLCVSALNECIVHSRNLLAFRKSAFFPPWFAYSLQLYLLICFLLHSPLCLHDFISLQNTLLIIFLEWLMIIRAATSIGNYFHNRFSHFSSTNAKNVMVPASRMWRFAAVFCLTW